MNKASTILFLCIIISFNIKAQHILSNNLVPNPSFEIFDTCPTANSQICHAIPWDGAFYYMSNYWSRSSDFFHTCSTDTEIQYILSLKSPHFGSGCAGICVYMKPPAWDNYREYIEVKLKNIFIKNKIYCSSFYSISSYGNIAVENIGMLISTNYVNSYNSIMPSYMLIDSVPQIKNTNGILTDTVNWTKVTGVYTANGGEKYITIGNFSDDAHTNWVALKPIYGIAYYLIDDVSVCECSFEIDLGADAKLCEGDSKLLTANLPNATFTWQDGSTNATYEVKTPGTYWVKAYVAEYDITSSDTILISAEDEKICNPPLIIPNFITPNGDAVNDNFQLGNADKFDISLQIYNRWGNLIYQNANYQNDYNCNGCANGVYYYLLSAKSKRNGKVKEYKGSITVM